MEKRKLPHLIGFGSSIILVSDYRDAWQFEPNLKVNVYAFRRAIMKFFDNVNLKKSDYVCFNTDYVRNQYCSSYPYLSYKVLPYIMAMMKMILKI